MINVVNTYYQPTTGFSVASEGVLLDRWRESWTKHGWFTRIIHESDARKAGAVVFAELQAAVKKLPTVNSKEYERDCYLRHLAMRGVGGGLMVDYDVINYGFTPSDLDSMTKIAGRMLFLDPTKVPCALEGDSEAFSHVVRTFIRVASGELRCDKTHNSDMTIIKEHVDGDVDPVVVEYRAPGWETSKLVHYSSASCSSIGRRGKPTLIDGVRPI